MASPLTYGAASTRTRLVWVARNIARRVGSDTLTWAAAVPAALTIRLDLSVADIEWRRALAALGVVAVLQALASVTAIWRWGRRHTASFGDALSTAAATGMATTGFFSLNLLVLHRLVPASVPIVAGLLAIGLQMATRAVIRARNDQGKRPNLATASAVLVFGAGDAGMQIVTAMLTTKDSPFVPVAILDDDFDKGDLRVLGVPVVGGRDQIAQASARYGATTLVVAIPNASRELIREVSEIAAAAHVKVRVLPPLGDRVGASVDLSDIRPLNEVDLLGRHEVDTDLRAIAGYLTGRRVLVTGAGGSIGAELCRQVARFDPASLVMLDRDESALHAVQLSICGRARLDDPNLVVADIRDTERMREVFERHLPDVVFHAAALKHLTLLQMHPSEAVKTNVVGTQNVLDAAVECGVRTFVNISTDKAANPTSVLGYSKRVAERLTAGVRVEGSTYLSVRFGNVLGSRGSVLTVFRHQIDTGGPVTVTHPEVSRFFMTIEEAVQLVIQAGAIGRHGEVLVLDMGEPVVIADVAKRLIEASGRDDITIEYTGLKPAEKMHEELFGAGERDERPRHPKISHVPVPALRSTDVWSVGATAMEVAERLPSLTGFAEAVVLDVRANP